MKPWVTVSALALVTVVGASGCKSESDTSGAAVGGLSAQTAGTSISFQLTPNPPSAGRLTFELRANTHSGDLSEVDLKQAMRLHVNGQSYEPVDVPSLTGHHDGGSVVFQPEGTPSPPFSVTIQGVRDMSELEFKW